MAKHPPLDGTFIGTQNATMFAPERSPISLADENLGRPEEDGGVIYIAGKGRSGTTLVGLVLGMLDDHIFIGDAKTIWNEGLHHNYLCNCGVPFRDCDFWTEVMEDAYGSVEECLKRNIHSVYDRAIKQAKFPEIHEPSRRSASLQRDIHTLEAETRKLHRSIRRVSGKSWIVDASKYPSYASLLAGLYGPKLKLVHLIRDPRGVAFSRTRAKVKPEVRDRSVTLNRHPPAVAARRWARRHRQIERLARRVDASRLRYEDFVRDTSGCLATFLSDAQVEQALRGLRAAGVERPATHAVAGNPHRFESSGLVLKLDEEWRSGLSAADRLRVRARCFRLMLAYGYLR